MWRTRYEAYGNTAAGTIPNGIGFTGHVNDPDTGLVYMQQRYYDPIAGRFMSLDPVTTDANTGKSFGRYHYANNNPFRFNDPDGREPNDDGCAKYAPYPCNDKFSSNADTSSSANSSGAALITNAPTAPGTGIGTIAGSGLKITGSTAWLLRVFGTLSLAATPSPLGDGTLYGASGLYAAKAEMIIYRVWGGDAGPLGRSWTPVNPMFIGSAYRNLAGLPDINERTKLSIGILVDHVGVVARPAIPLDGNRGGLPELRVPNPGTQIRVIHTQIMNPPF